ncbi:EndoU nuclease [Planococcus glaciei]|uniref:EndoU domain-containing protein n=1 Tax=Planococcus glaciei TaxID=459472 RepID=UPI00087FDD4E|nr:EndoU domain-containing protein [Planococcus glaciei]SDG82839.1 EndoU nuclease [Planococcus glaciei]
MNTNKIKSSLTVILVLTLLISLLPVYSTPEVSASGNNVSKSLSWLQKQTDRPSYPSQLSLTQSYSDDYTGHVEGSVDLSSLPNHTSKAVPSIQSNQSYSSGYTGEVSGIWKNIDSTENYSVIVYDKTDINYEIAKVELKSDGTWNAGELKINGTPTIVLVDSENKIVAYAESDSVEQVIKEYEVWIYSVSDIPYIQAKVPIKLNGTFTTKNPVNILGLEVDIFNGVKEGRKIARIVRVSDEKVYGTTEVPKYQLIRSYNVPIDDPVNTLGIDRRSWIYDDALAVMAFSMAGDRSRASAILSSLTQLQNEDGSLAFSYDIYSGPLDERKRSGSIAWVGDSAVKYEETFGDASYRGLALRIADFLLTQQNPSTGSIKGGPDVPWYSTEHNIDSYFFFRNLGELTGNKKYSSAANRIQHALLTYHWNHAEKRFNQGINDPAAALDTNSWGSIFLEAIGRFDLSQTATAYIDQFEVNDASMSLSNDENSYNMTYQTSSLLSGYKPYGAGYSDAPNIVWTEGTWGVINLFMRQGKDVSKLVNSMFAMQNADPEGGLAYTNEGYAPFPYELHVWSSVAATAWQYITLMDPRGIWDDNKHNETAGIGDLLEDNNSLETATETAAESFEHLTLHNSTDVDYYKFTADFDGTIKVSIPEVSDYKVEVITPEGTSQQTEISGYRTVDIATEEQQTYYIKVSSPTASGTASTPYSLNFSSEGEFQHKLLLDGLNTSHSAAQIQEMQELMTKMKFYDGPITSTYSNEVFNSVIAYQTALNKWDPRTEMGGLFELNGNFDNRLLGYARDDVSLGRNAEGEIYKTFFTGDKVILALTGEYAAGLAFEAVVMYRLGNAYKASTFTAKTADSLVDDAISAIPVVLQASAREHIIKVETFTRKAGIKGGHNMGEFNKYIVDKPITITSRTPHPTIDGITLIRYQYPKYYNGEILEGEFNFRLKTVYDPAVFTDDEIIQLGIEAMQNGLNAGTFEIRSGNTTSIDGVASNGLQFKGFRNEITNEITNFFPVIEQTN